MPLTASRIAHLLEPYTAIAPDASIEWPRVYDQLTEYLHILVRWNARMNLTAIHSPEEIVRRHFGESLFAGLHLGCSTWNIPPGVRIAGSCPTERQLLDFGSGAGFPGLPIQILWPELHVTLAEARHKKASFLREVIRSLHLHTEVWGERVEKMPANRKFSVVTMRAVDEMDAAVAAAAERAGDVLLILGTSNAGYGFLAPRFTAPELTPIPETNDGVLMLFRQVQA